MGTEVTVILSVYIWVFLSGPHDSIVYFPSFKGDM
jgi:hypothetical protein